LGDDRAAADQPGEAGKDWDGIEKLWRDFDEKSILAAIQVKT
jgi:hypothetical protein